jgi:hypothetical protein
MKYCLSSDQSITLLKKVDEISLKSKDWQYFPVLREKYPEKDIIIKVNRDFSLQLFLEDNISQLEKLIFACDNYEQMKLCKEYGVRFYYNYTTTSFYELESLKELGVCYILVGIPLFFDLKNVAAYNVPLRAIPNLAYEPYLPHENGICGQWIRPEDVNNYSEYIDVLEFYAEGDNKVLKEATMYKIYAEDKTWPGNLNLIIDNLNFNVDNRLFYYEDNLAERRMNCQHKCKVRPGSCRFCERQFQFESVLREYAKSKE